MKERKKQQTIYSSEFECEIWIDGGLLFLISPFRCIFWIICGNFGLFKPFQRVFGAHFTIFRSLREATAIGALENRKSKPQGRMKLPKIPTEVHQKTKRRLQKIPGIGGRLETKSWRGQADDKRVKIASNCGHVAKSNDDPIFNSNNKSNCNNNSSN